MNYHRKVFSCNKNTLSRLCTTWPWTEHKRSHGQESMFKEILLQRNPIAFLLQLLLLLSFCTLSKILCDAHYIPRRMPNRAMLHNREYCFYTESGPFIFKHLWGTTMWLKPNLYFSKPTHVRTENQIA